jgi:6-phosphogluconolactonase (cycloisomerase 2 family)
MRRHSGRSQFYRGCARSHFRIRLTAFLRFLVPLLFCVALNVAARGTTPAVVVMSPANNSQVSSPVHYVASATSFQCSKGIAAIRIYLAPHVSAYTINSNDLDHYQPLSPGTYDTVVQAWDNCGGVGKTAVNITVSANGLRPARFLYLTTSSSENKRIWGYLVNPDTGALTLTKQGPLAGVEAAFALASDKRGYRLYVMPDAQFPNSDDAAGYFIDRRNGYLRPVPGSPFFLGFSIAAVTVHPSGRFVYAGNVDLGVGNPGILVFAVNTDGSLALLTTTPVPTQSSPVSMAIDPSGRYLYAASVGRLIDGFDIDGASGALTPLPGSPFTSNTSGCIFGGADAVADLMGRYLYASHDSVLAISGFAIGPTTGNLVEIAGSPFPEHGSTGCNFTGQITGLTTEPTGRFLYVGNTSTDTSNVHTISIFSINAGNGALRHIKDTPSNYASYSGSGMLRADPSGKYLYTFGNSNIAGHNPLDQVIGFSINGSTGDLTALPSSPFTIPTNLAEGFALVVTP